MVKVRFGKFTIFLIHALMIIFAFLIQTSIFPLLPMFNSSPNLLLIITFSYGLLYGEDIGMFTGLFCGLLCDIYYNGVFGLFVLIYSVIGYINGVLNSSFFENSITLPILLSVINGLIYNFYIYITHFLIRGRFNLPYYFINIMIPNVLFTLIVTVFIYKILSKLDLVNLKRT